MSKRKCPRCRQWLEPYSEGCYCGWESVSSDFSHEPDHQCSYAISGRRCPLDGTNNKSTHGGGAYYCLDHYRNLHDPQQCLEILEDAEMNFESIIERRIDWRARLFPEEYEIRKSNIRRLFDSLRMTFKTKLKKIL